VPAALYPQEDSWYSFLSRPQDHGAAGRIRLIEKSSDLIGNRTRDLSACSIVPQPRAPYKRGMHWITGIIVRLYTLLETAINYSAIANVHTLQIIRTRYALSVFLSRILATDL
jgi:hypothetical protein